MFSLIHEKRWLWPFSDIVCCLFLGDEFAKTSLTVVFVICFSVIGFVLIMAGIFVCFKITRGSFRQTGKPCDKNIDTKSHGMTQNYDDLHDTAREVAYTALGQSEMETTYEDM